MGRKHDDSREHALDQVRALCVHAVMHADEYVQRGLPADRRKEMCRLLVERKAHLELTVRHDGASMRAELRLVEFGTPSFPDPLLTIEREYGAGKSAGSH
jgi:hypothetical protein